MGFFRRQREPDPQNVALVERLDSLGFFEYAEDPAAAKAEFERRGTDGFWWAEHGRSLVFADSEDLAEGGIAEAVNELQPLLARMGVLLEDDAEDEIDERRYVVRAGGREYVIYDLDAADALDIEDEMLRMWVLAWTRTIRILNDLLEDAKSPERVYAGYEHQLWFLTSAQFDAVTEVLGGSRSRPYVPTEEPPRYGEPLDPD
jgi:hypothetical protein